MINSNTKHDITYFLALEFFVVLIANLVLFSTAFIFGGENNINKMASSVNGSFEPYYAIALTINSFIGVFILWIAVNTNLKYKKFLIDAASNLYDMFCSILRLAGGFLVIFPILYFLMEGSSRSLPFFLFYGCLAIAESAFFMWFKNVIFTRKNRELKGGFY